MHTTQNADATVFRSFQELVSSRTLMHVLINEIYNMAIISQHDSTQVQYFTIPANQLNIMYQKSLPEGNVNITRRMHTLAGQMNAHQKLRTAKNHKNNLGKTSGKFKVHALQLFMYAFLYLSEWIAVLPRGFWVLFGQSDAEACWT